VGTRVYPSTRKQLSSPKNPPWQSGSVFPPKENLPVASQDTPSHQPCCFSGHLLTQKVLHPLPAVTHLPQSPLIKHPSPRRGTRVAASAAETRAAPAPSSLLYTSSQFGPVPHPVTSGFASPLPFPCLCGHPGPPTPPKRGTLPAAESRVTTT